VSDRSDTKTPLEITGINWVTSVFLIATFVVSLILTPLYLLRFGFGLFEAVLFLVMFALSGLSITVGYHRLFTHRAFAASWPVRLVAALFGAATFEMSALQWCSEHRYHHKYTDQDGDPHDPHSIHRGFFWAHMGWLLVHVNPKLKHDNVPDLRKDPILVWQDKYYVWIAIAVGFLLPVAAGLIWALQSSATLFQGLLAGFIFGGCLRIVIVQHFTFFINSLAHTFGTRPYDSESSSRDSAILAFFTFGEGYHNYHHAFQTDYRNGVRAWQWDPSKWTIWTLSKLGLASDLRKIPAETIRMARVREKSRQLKRRLEEVGTSDRGAELSAAVAARLGELEQRLEDLHLQCRVAMNEYQTAARRRQKARRDKAAELKRELQHLRSEFRRNLKAWKMAHREALAMV
jgi:stearoyl-CoA desaturase (delta-9 desaturase)